MNAKMLVSNSDNHSSRNNSLIPVDHIARQSGFLFSVTVTPAIIDHVFLADGEHSVDECLNLFLRTCAEQMKISVIDCKNWQRTRMFYPMPTIDGFFSPEEVLIKADNGNISIMLAFEEPLIKH
jgi:small nuclear ribonucleoprotein (snRNP)-like protein